MIWLLVALGVVVAAAFWLQAKPQKPAGATIARINGTGTYDTEVVGESHYAPAFEALLGSTACTDNDLTCDAILQLEDGNPHDPKAVAVLIDGHRVGYLARAMARDFRAALVRDGVGGRTQYAVGARVYAGGSERMYSVQLDLPQA